MFFCGFDTFTFNPEISSSGLSSNDETITETNYISKERLSDIKRQVKWCRTKIGVDTYTNPKGYTYKWPTMLAFIRKL